MKKSGYPSHSIREARIPNTVNLSGWRFYGFAGLLVGTLALTMYPVIIDPILHVDKYKESHKKMQTELFQAGLLPGQLKKWDDPWDPKKK